MEDLGVLPPFSEFSTGDQARTLEIVSKNLRGKPLPVDYDFNKVRTLVGEIDLVTQYLKEEGKEWSELAADYYDTAQTILRV